MPADIHQTDEKESDLPLILFTVCTPSAVGVSLIGLFAGSAFPFAVAALALTIIGMVASVAHLAKPLRAPYSIRHWDGSWLSREILVVSLFAVMLCLWVLLDLLMILGILSVDGFFAFSWIACAASIVCGAFLLNAISNAYCVHGQPAWDGRDTLMEIVSIACGCGGSVSLILLGAMAIFGYGLWIFAAIASAALCIIGATVQQKSWDARMARVKKLAEYDGTPRAVNAEVLISEASTGAERDNKWLIIASVIAAISAVVYCLSWFIADLVIYALWIVVALATISAVLELIGSVRIRDRFYGLAQTSRYAMRLHKW